MSRSKKIKMKALLINPKNPETFWSHKHSLKLMGKKTGYPPLGILIVASLLPKRWKKKFICLNSVELNEKDLKWADYVFISAMVAQKDSASEIIRKCKKLGIKVIAGGPLFACNPELADDADHLILNEAEVTLPGFLKDLKKGKTKKIYSSSEFADMERSPVPMMELIDMKNYIGMALQYSRGCPYDCEFCCVTKLFGRKVRTKTKKQVIAELDSLYELGWRGGVFFVDDNFIGDKAKLKEEILPAITRWMRKRGYPFVFTTQASMNLADDNELMNMMTGAGFDCVFVGIESIDEASLAEANKFINRNRDLVASVKRLHQAGLRVYGSFIVGFDNDTPSTFGRMARFIDKSNIPIAMVGILNAGKGTRIHDRLKNENRLICDSQGDNTDFSLNFVPKMEASTLVNGCKGILKKTYAPENHYSRLKRYINDFHPPRIRRKAATFSSNVTYLKSLVKSMFTLGIVDEGRAYYWKILFWSAFRRPELFMTAMTLWIIGCDLRKTLNE